MALLFSDSFDHYATALVNVKYSGSSSHTIIAGGRNGTNALSCGSTGLISAIVGSKTSLVVGGAFYFTSFGAGGQPFLAFVDSSTRHIDLRVSAGGILSVTRNGTALTGGVGTTALSLSQFYYIEIKALIDDAAGTVEVRLNGLSTPEINVTGEDTRNGANSSADRITIGQHTSGTGNFHSFRLDDFYICDTIDQSIAQPGSLPNNDFLGDIRVQALFPNGNGTSSQLAGSDGNSVDNYLLIDESTPNSDTDYVASAAVGNKDTYEYDSLIPTTGVVFGVNMLPFAAKTDAGVRSIATVTRVDGVEEDGANKVLLTTYDYYSDIRGATPTASGWTIADVNAAEFGVKITA